MMTQLMGREDIFKMGDKLRFFNDELEAGTITKFTSDSKLIRRFVDAKFQGNYRNLTYDCNCPEKTVFKNLIFLLYINYYFLK
jgi:hypothetical protein